MKGELILVDNVFSEENEFEMGVSAQDFGLNIYVDDEDTLEKQLKNRKSFDYCMNAIAEYQALTGDVNEEILKEIDYISEHFDNLLDSVEFIK